MCVWIRRVVFFSMASLVLCLSHAIVAHAKINEEIPDVQSGELSQAIVSAHGSGRWLVEQVLQLFDQRASAKCYMNHYGSLQSDSYLSFAHGPKSHIPSHSFPWLGFRGHFNFFKPPGRCRKSRRLSYNSSCSRKHNKKLGKSSPYSFPYPFRAPEVRNLPLPLRADLHLSA